MDHLVVDGVHVDVEKDLHELTAVDSLQVLLDLEVEVQEEVLLDIPLVIH